MGRFIVNGGKRLFGNVKISGSKNAALPLIFATVVTKGESVLHNVPDISDVDIAIELIISLGARVERCGEALYVDTTDLRYNKPSEDLVSKIRASSYLMGANLARFGICHLQSFGGCNFDSRPIDMHIYALESFGGRRMGDTFFAKRLYPAKIFYNKISVGATVNALILAAATPAKSCIYGYAKEPHVISLVDFLRSAGADISLYADRIEVVGRELVGGEGTAVSDMIEAGTYAALSLLTDSKITLTDAPVRDLSSFFSPFIDAGVLVFESDRSLSVSGPITDFINIITEPYPGFPTDLQPQTAPLLASSFGGRITERVWQKRFGYLAQLEKFGVRYELCQNSALIRPSRLRSAIADAPDLRAGAALLMCALATEGESVINNSEIIKRGYSDIVKKLRLIGAEIYEEL